MPLPAPRLWTSGLPTVKEQTVVVLNHQRCSYLLETQQNANTRFFLFFFFLNKSFRFLVAKISLYKCALTLEGQDETHTHTHNTRTAKGCKINNGLHFQLLCQVSLVIHYNASK